MHIRENLVLIFIIVLITFGVYFDSFNNQFVYDDYPFLVDNPVVKGMHLRSLIPDVFSRPSVSSSEPLAKDVWRPMMVLSLAVDHKLWGLNSRLYHIENTLLHAANALLVYLLVMLMIGNPFASFIAAIVFAVHPVQTEAVTWVSGRSNVLFLLFFLAAFISHVRSRKAPTHGGYYALSLVFFFLSLLSKEMAIVFPLLCILYDAHFFTKEKMGRYAAYYAPFFIVAALYIAARASVLGVIAQKGQWWGGGVAANAVLTVKALAEYVRLAILPVNLGIEYSPDAFSAVFTAGAIAGAAILTPVAILYIATRRNKTAAFSFAWFFVALLPVYNIVPLKALMAERFLYLPIIGYAILFGMLFAHVADKWRVRDAVRTAVSISLTLVITAYALMSVSRNIEWRDEMVFYGREAGRSPLSAKAHYNYGYSCMKEALRLPPGSAGAARYFAMAIAEYEKAVSLRPESQSAHLAAANALNAVGMYDQAIAHFRKALSIREHADIYNNLGVSYYRKGSFDEAERCFRAALLADPSHINASVNIGNIYYLKGEFRKAKRAWLRAVVLGGRNAYIDGRIGELEGRGF